MDGSGKGQRGSPAAVPEAKESAVVPAYEEGGLVTETGLALIHEGEYIVPAQGSEAIVESLGPSAAQQTIHYHFPLEVVVTGSVSEAEREQIEERIWESLSDALDSLGVG